MASKKSAKQTTDKKAKFLTDLRLHIDVLKSNHQEFGDEIRKLQGGSQESAATRKAKIADITVTLLPDLDTDRLNELKKVFSFAPTPADVKQLRDEENEKLNREQARLCPGFNPSTYDSVMASIDLNADSCNIKILEISDSFAATPKLRQLFKSGYGTEKYLYSLFSFDFLTVCSDWKRADEIVEELKMNDWSEVLNYCRILDDQLKEENRKLSSLQSQKEQLERVNQSYFDIEKLRKSVFSVVWEKLQLAFRASLDSFEGPVPEGVHDHVQNSLQVILSCNSEMTKSELIRNKLQSARQSLTAEIGKLEQLYVAAEKSRTKDIPDNFVGLTPQAQTRASSFSHGSSGHSTRVEHHFNYDSGMDFSTYLYYDHMLNHFQSAPVVVVHEVERVIPEDRQVTSDYDRFGRVS